MDIFVVEKQRLELWNQLHSVKSPLTSFFLIYDFYEKLKAYNDPILVESFLNEILLQLIESLKQFILEGLNPKIILQLKNFILELLLYDLDKKCLEILTDYQTIINEHFEELNRLLEGKENLINQSKLSFPVIINELSLGTYGNVDSLSIQINKLPKSYQNEFLIIPSTGKIEERLQEQIENSWSLATKYFQERIHKKLQFHQVIIILNNRFSSYEGYSLGFTLTIGFIQELFKYYNTSFSVKVKPNLALSGGLDSTGEAKILGKHIVETKTETIFYSKNKIFIIPEEDFNFARNILIELKNLYPKRQLKLIPISDFEDLLGNRQILEIEKVRIHKRAIKFSKENVLPLVLSALLILIAVLYVIFTTDNNPAEFKRVGNTLHILNKYGNVLWSTTQNSENADDKSHIRLIDVDRDSIKEIILGRHKIEDHTANEIACYSNLGKLIWAYKFNDTIKGIADTYYNFPSNYILDLTTINDTLMVYCFSRHNYWPSAIFRLNAKTGERLNGTLWNPGHFASGAIGDFNNDGKKELITAGINNGFEKVFLMNIDLDKINGQTIGLGEYKFINLPTALFNEYILISKSDLSDYYNMRFNSAKSVSYSNIYDNFQINIIEGKPNNGLMYWFEKDFNNVSVSIGDDFQYDRDNLVKKGLIKGTFTMDPLYEEQLINGILRWNGKEFVRFKN